MSPYIKKCSQPFLRTSSSGQEKKKNKKTTTKKNTSQFGVFMKKVERKDGVRTIVGKRQESWYADLKKKKKLQNITFQLLCSECDGNTSSPVYKSVVRLCLQNDIL